MNGEFKKAYRQVHLDFHTSPDVSGIGNEFSKENFQAALVKGKLDSITIFAKCHHGYCYYPTSVGTMHPELDFDMTGAMIDAAHEVGVRAPVYITAGWSQLDAIEHSNWRSVSEDGSYTSHESIAVEGPDGEFKDYYSWYMMCLNDGEYAEHIYELTEEIAARYENLDGLFYDICFMEEACYCKTCKKGMIDMGLNPENDEDAKKYLIIKRQAFMTKCTDILRKYHPNATIFFNSGGADPYKPEYHAYPTHFEMEDLPTSEGDYNKLPLRAKYFLNTGKHYVAMSGKFHLAWGEFGGYKPKEALKFEVAEMAMYGAGASIGDHMHPCGEMEMQTYENIGYAYDYLDKIAPYCYSGEYLCDIGIYMSGDHEANQGIADILLENQIDFGVVCNNDFARYDTVIIAEGAEFDETAKVKFDEYIKNGGKVMLMGDTLIKDGKFEIDFGAEYIGKPLFDCDYIMPCEKREELPNAPMYCPEPGVRVKQCGAELAAEFIMPYFSRTYDKFFGHKNTPYDKNSERFPAILKNGNVVYTAHSFAKLYKIHGSVFHKRYFMYALNLIYGGGTVKVQGLGSEGRMTAIHQADKNRYCINLLYATPLKRGEATVIDEIVPVYNIGVSLKTDKAVKRVILPLTGESLEFSREGDIVRFVVPKLECHTVIAVQY